MDEVKKKYEERENRWSLFRNTKKDKESSPDFSGNINIEGKLYKLSGWITETATNRFFSGSVRPVIAPETIDEDIPF